ncbi:hypothetical protein D3C78_1162980 [compost metagenome]
MIALSRIFQNGIFAFFTKLLDDFVSREFRLGDIIRGDVGGALRLRRIRRKSRHRNAGANRLVDGFDKWIGLHRVQQDAFRLLHEFLLEGRDLLGDVIFRRTGKNGLAAERLCCLLEALKDRHPIGVAGNHDVHHIGLARLAGEFARSDGLRTGTSGNRHG